MNDPAEKKLWGPPQSLKLSSLQDMPYQPYSKQDKLGNYCTWDNEDNKENTTKFRRQRVGAGSLAFGASVSSLFTYVHDEDKSSFSVVDSKKDNFKSNVKKSSK
jgi:translation initiation factor 3 subunit D